MRTKITASFLKTATPETFRQWYALFFSDGKNVDIILLKTQVRIKMSTTVYVVDIERSQDKLMTEKNPPRITARVPQCSVGTGFYVFKNRGEVGLTVGHWTDIEAPEIPRLRHQVHRLSTDIRGLK